MRLLIISLIFLASLSALGQDKPEPRLVDEFSRLGCCCDVGARIGNLVLQLEASANSLGYIVISEPTTEYGRWRERYFDGYVRLAGLEDRVRIVRVSGNGDALLTRFWIVPAGTTLEGNFLGTESYQLATSSQKVLFFNSDSQLCSSVAPIDTLAKYLVANSQWNANIAVGAKSKAEYKIETKKISDRLAGTHGVDSKRLRFFRMNGNFDEKYYEIWLIRKR